MLKNDKLYGSIIPADVHTLRIRGLSLGEHVELQILALTDHPVGRGGKGEEKQDHDSGIGTVSTSPDGECLLCKYDSVEGSTDVIW